MAVQMSAQYLGDLECDVQHEPSGTHIKTDAPTDNQGKGSTFSPTDLVGAALANCALTTMALAARAQGFELQPANAVVEKHMSPAPDRYIQRLVLSIQLAQPLDDQQKTVLEGAAHQCPVAKSLGRTQLAITFTYSA